MPHQGLTVLANSELITRLRYRLSGCISDNETKIAHAITRIIDRCPTLEFEIKLGQIGHKSATEATLD